MTIARTTADALLPELLEWSSSFAADRAFLREDLLGSAAHVTMLARCGIVPEDAAVAIRRELLALNELSAGEEDVHMAVETTLTERLGADIAGHLHTARSRNDQVALDLRLHVREQARQTLVSLLGLIDDVLARAEQEHDTLLPAYTHRQRAQPITGAFLLCAWASSLMRAAHVLKAAITEADKLPLGAGACSGSSLPIDRRITQRLLSFSAVTTNALDTVGDRDFALDWTWAGARVLLALSRIATDVIDMATSEFAFVSLDGNVSCGSSMMPQKRNPDMFELVRGQAARASGNVMHMLMLMKGLPSGYNRDQQEDRAAVLSAGPLVLGALKTMRLALPHVRFNRERCLAALQDGFTQATDLAEGLVQAGVPFREAYKATGALVRTALERGVTLSSIDDATARAVHPRFDLSRLDPHAAVAAKQSLGGTGDVPVQIILLRQEARALAPKVPSLDALFERLKAM